MLDVKLITELSAAEQAALPPGQWGPRSVIIREAFPGKGREPRHFFRRASLALKGKAAARNVEAACLKAYALMESGCGVAVAAGGFSQAGGYDPLPDFREVQQRAARLKARPGGESFPARRFREALAGWVRLFEQYSATERMAV
ncbi:hypothetical protein ACFOD9_01490 [Novosphingobium bradum]|uniref:Uncharacterized protein n=1 Tax=Novosphingobium bradum TaxID=1737444 RepID=A0ABV7IPX9_9SPHN